MKNYFIFFMTVLLTAGCGDTINNYYCDCSADDEDIVTIDSILSDDDNTLIEPDENNDEKDDFDEDFIENDINETDDSITIPDYDILEDICFFIKEAGIVAKCFKSTTTEELIYISTSKMTDKCKATVESSTKPTRTFFGVELPFLNETGESTLDYNPSTEKVLLDGEEFEESPC